jgi:PAS domain S-box-containing protein
MNKYRAKYIELSDLGRKYFLQLISVSSILMVFIFWVFELNYHNLPFTGNAWLIIHKSPSLWFIDLLPALSFFISYHIIKNKKETEQNFAKRLEAKNNIISYHTENAVKLGRSDFSFVINPLNDNDELGEALRYLKGYLKANQRKEKDLNWISEGKNLISRILRMHTDLNNLANEVLKVLVSYMAVEQGAFYVYNEEEKTLECIAIYAYNRRKYLNKKFKLGHGLVGQCAYEMDFIYRTEIPEDYVTITSGILGDQKPKSILLVPLISDEKLQGVMEFASVQNKFQKLSIQFTLELGEIISRTIYNLMINQKTELLLKESRKMTEELRRNEKAMQENAERMNVTQKELKESNAQLESKMREVHNAQGKLHWLLENASEVISIYDEKINLSYISPSVNKILGYDSEEMRKGKDFERLTREGAEQLKTLILESMENPDSQKTIQYSFITKDGERIYLESSAKNLMSDPSINGIIVNTRDITEKIRAEKEERLKSRMQSLSENSLDMIIRLSVDGQFHYVNPVVEDYIGINAEGLIGKMLSELEFAEDLHELFESGLLNLKNNPRKTNEEVSIPVRMGEKLSERILSIDAIPEFNKSELETILFVGHDITEAKRIGKEIQIKNKKIEDSINYAEKIQKALLADIELFSEFFRKSFIFYKPRDVVSGDFPWFLRMGDEVFVSAIDCTGHGVPGALLSFIAFFLLKDVVHTHYDENSGKICDLLHANFRETLKQNTDKADSRDGLDIAFCKINLKSSTLHFAGAHRQLYLLRSGEITEYKGDRKAIGGIPLFKKTEEDFTNYEIKIQTGDKIFFFTDGMPDQLGGPYGRKYSPKRIRDMILENPGFTMNQYHELFESDFIEWNKGFRQLDDVLMMGIEF